MTPLVDSEMYTFMNLYDLLLMVCWVSLHIVKRKLNSLNSCILRIGRQNLLSLSHCLYVKHLLYSIGRQFCSYSRETLELYTAR